MKTLSLLSQLLRHGGATFLLALMVPSLVFADCSLTRLGFAPLCDLGPGTYLGQQGGLYPNGLNQRPAAHEAAGLAIATTQIKPRDAAGNVDAANGKIVLMSLGLSNTTQEWATRGTANFTAQATADPSRNPQMVIVDGAQGGRDVFSWSNPSDQAWTNVTARLGAASVTSSQVQAVWLKLTIANPRETFPAHAQTFRAKLREVITVAKQKLPNLAIVYVSSRTRAYVQAASGANPENFAYESGFGVKWMIEDQINNGLLNYDPARGPVVAPWVAWAPYLWVDGESPRSDGLTWSCTDVVGDFYHPSANGCEKVGRQLLTFFKTDPTARPWFLKSAVTGSAPTAAPTASRTSGAAPFTATFTANASDSDGTIVDYRWNFDDGTSAATASPTKTFLVPGTHQVRLTVTDNAGNTTTATVPITVAASSGPVALAVASAAALPAGTTGTAYAHTLVATGGTTPYTWSIVSGALPAGLALSAAGVVSGTPTATGTASFSARVADAAGGSATQAFTLAISAAASSDGPLETLADGSEGRTTTYRSATGETIAAYVRKPAGAGPFPLVLLAHGGGTSPNGTYALGRQMTPPTSNLIAAGFAVYSMDYSAVAGNALSVDEWQLAASALATARQLPYVDPLRLAMLGQSHGGTLSCRAASYLDLLAAIPCAPAGIDPLAAYRFQQAGGTISPNLQRVITDTAALYRVPIATLAANPAASGYRDVTDDAPTVRYPLLLVSGLNDSSSPPDVMNDYGAALTAAGKHFETYYPANGPHGFVVSSPRIPETDEFARRAVAFLGKYFSLADTDADGLPDGWELSRFNNLTQGPADDPDGDGQNNLAEHRAGTHPLLSTRTTGSGGGNTGRLVNLSILSALAAGETLTMGAVIGGSGTSGVKPLLARAAGPSLAPFGASDLLPDPKLSLVASAGGAVVATNNDWGANAAALTTAFAQTGAFAFLSTASRDAAIFAPQLSAGSYTVLVSDNATGTGTAIAELYDATPSASFTAATPRLINVSVLKHLGTGLTVGFVVGGTGSKTLLIRAIGPTVGAAPFNVAGVVSDPQLTLYSGQTTIGSNDNWGGTAALTAAFRQAGAFALPTASRDAALLATALPGSYTVLVSGVGGQTGVALIELYEVP